MKYAQFQFCYHFCTRRAGQVVFGDAPTLSNHDRNKLSIRANSCAWCKSQPSPPSIDSYHHHYQSVPLQDVPNNSHLVVEVILDARLVRCTRAVLMMMLKCEAECDRHQKVAPYYQWLPLSKQTTPS